MDVTEGRMHMMRKYVGALAIIILLLVLGAWYFFLRTNNSIGATITVEPTTFAQQISVSGTVQAAQNVDLGFAQSGRVSGVYASVGDTVKAGTLLAEIDNGDLRAALEEAQASLDAQEANLASLEAGTRPEQIAITQSAIASDEAALSQANAAIVNAIQSAYSQSDDAVHNKVDSFFTNPRTSSPQLVFSTTNSQIAAAIVNDRIAAEPLLLAWQIQSASLSTTTDPTAAASAAQANLAQIAQLLSDANAALNASSPSASASSAAIAGYTTAVATARANVNAAVAALTAAQSAQTSAQAALVRDQKNLTLEEAGSTSQTIDAQEAQVAAAQASVQNAQALLDKTLVRAPFDGVVTRMDAKVGEVISPTDPQISMISQGLFQIVAYVPEVEIAGLAVGDSATTTLDAYGPDTYFPATVIAVDPAETMQNGVATYKTTLQFTSLDPRILSGMTAEVVITTNAVEGALVVPQGALFTKGGTQMLQLDRAGAVVDVPVQTDTAPALGNVRITSGLSSGDVVILNPDPSR